MAQFSTGCIVIGGTVCLAASFIQVVILHTIPGSRRWNPPHSLRRAGLLSAAQFRCGVHRGAKKWLLSGAQFGLFFCGRQVVIHSTICAVGKIRLLLSAAHFGISSAFQTCPSRVVIQRTFPAVGLLSGAQFPNCRILAAVVIDGTIQGFFSTGCYSAHISPRQDFSIRPVGMLRTFLTFPFFAPGVVILDTF